MTHDHPAHAGPIGIIGSTSANALAAEADVMLAIGTRLMDFTTGSWTVFNHDARIIGINAARWDATKHRALAVVGDARETVTEIDAALGDWKAPAGWTSNARKLMGEWDELVDDYQKPTNAPVPTYAQVIAAVQQARSRPIRSSARPAVCRASWSRAGGSRNRTPSIASSASPAWATRSPPVGLCHGQPDTTPIVMVGDGTYLMMNSDIYSTVLTGHKMIVVVCDNGGYAVINRLQNFKGTPAFNNLIKDSRVKRAVRGRFRQARRVDGRAGAPLREPRRTSRRRMKWAQGTTAPR